MVLHLIANQAALKEAIGVRVPVYPPSFVTQKNGPPSRLATVG